MKDRYTLSIFIFLLASLCSCHLSGQITKQSQALVSDNLLAPAHVGISIYEPATGKFWLDYQSEKYFLPASNTKLFSLYAGLKYLGDSLPSAKYRYSGNDLLIFPSGDPTFLHPDFSFQPLYDFLKTKPSFRIVTNAWQTKAWGFGWAWDDYQDDYMAERSLMPIYGNVTDIQWKKDSLVFAPFGNFKVVKQEGLKGSAFTLERANQENLFLLSPSGKRFGATVMPIRMDNGTVRSLLLGSALQAGPDSLLFYHLEKPGTDSPVFTIRSQPADSMYRLMMHRSDNFFAEQTLLMASNEKLGVMDEARMIDTLLNNDLSGLPQKPKWVDGSGLSRYNLFTPRSFVYLLDKMQQEFGLARLKAILPSGGQGTLKNYYQEDSGHIWAKTGTLSNNLALSGFLETKQKKLLIFSIMVNAYPGGATPIRRKIEAFLKTLRAEN